MVDPITAVEAINNSFMTATSDTQEKSYVVRLKYATLRDMQAGHSALVRLAGAGASASTRDAVARALYEEHRHVVSGRPPWERLRDEDLYHKGMKEVAYRDADVALEVMAGLAGGEVRAGSIHADQIPAAEGNVAEQLIGPAGLQA